MVLRYEEVGRLTDGHEKGITTVAFSPKGTYIATAGLDGRICVWDVSSMALLYSFEGDSPVLSLIWLPPGENAMLCGFLDSNMAMLKITPSRLRVKGFWSHAYPVESLAFRPEDQRLASGAHHELLIWRWEEQDGIFHLDCDISDVLKNSRTDSSEVLITSLHWTSSRQHPELLLITYMHHGLVLLDSSNWTRIRTIPLHGLIGDASLSDDGMRLAISNVHRGFDVYSMESGAPLCTIEHGFRGTSPTPVLFIHGGLALLAGSTAGELNIWDVMNTETGLPMLNTPELDDAQPQVLHTLTIPKHAKVLAVSAYYNEQKDEFFIAAGIMNEFSPSNAILWKAAEEGYVRADESLEHDTHSSTLGSMCGRMVFVALVLVVGAVALAVPNVWNFDRGVDVPSASV